MDYSKMSVLDLKRVLDPIQAKMDSVKKIGGEQERANAFWGMRDQVEIAEAIIEELASRKTK